MSKRQEVVEVLQRIAFAAEVLDDTSIDAQVISTGAWNLRQIEGDFDALVREKDFGRIANVRKPVVEIARRVVLGEPVPELAALEARVPEGLFQVRRVKGLGPKKIRALWQSLGITTLGELEYACHENRLVELKGFGKKTQENVRAAIEELRKNEGSFLMNQGLLIAGQTLSKLREDGAILRAELAGDLRRGAEVIKSIQIVVLLRDASDEARIRSLASEVVTGLPIEITVVTAPERFGTVLFARTGSPEFVQEMEARSKERGLSLDGLLAAEEEQVFSALGLLPIDPEQREANAPRWEIGRARPRLIRREDLVGALHNHTLASDGASTLEQMRAAAIAAGLRYLAITDHSQTASYARGLDAERLADQHSEVLALNRDADGERCPILHGVESDILGDGTLDYPPDVLAGLDLVVASVHNRLGQKRPEMTVRMTRAASDPFTDIVGHPTGRLLLGRAPSDFDMDAFLDACKSSGCAVELNSSPHRLDLHELHLKMAKERGIPISIGADAHSTEELGFLEYGVRIARRAGLSPEDVLNTRPLDQLRAWLRERRSRATSAHGS
jgi:DNA polymerase (family 10)